MNELISIITPTYNRALLVQQTIKSILQQTYTHWELIIVDDGSTDDTEAVIQPYLADRRIQYFRKPNSGQADSLNQGAKMAKGDFITFLDSDDEAYNNWLQVIASRITSNTGIVCADAIRRFSDGSRVNDGMGTYRFFGKIFHLKFTCGSLFIKRKIFNDINGYDASLRSNIQTDLGYRLLAYLQQSNLDAVVVDDCLVQINVHEGERIRTNWNRRREGGIQFIKKHYRFIYENDKKEIGNIYSSIAYSSYKLSKRKESVSFLLQAIRHNPLRWINYMRVFKYAFL